MEDQKTGCTRRCSCWPGDERCCGIAGERGQRQGKGAAQAPLAAGAVLQRLPRAPGTARRSDATLGPALDPSGTPVGGAEYLSTKLNQLREGRRNSLTVAAGDLIGGIAVPVRPVPRRAGGGVARGDGARRLERRQPRVRRGRHRAAADAERRLPPGRRLLLPGRSRTTARTSRGWPPTWSTSATGKTVLPPHWIKKVEGVKVGFIGMTLEGTPDARGRQAGIAGLDVPGRGRDRQRGRRQQLQAAGRQGDRRAAARGRRPDRHLSTSAPASPARSSTSPTNLDPEIDAVVTGHTHQPYICTIPDPAGQSRDGDLGVVVRPGGHRDLADHRHEDAATSSATRPRRDQPPGDPDRSRRPGADRRSSTKWNAIAAPDRQPRRRHDHRRHHPTPVNRDTETPWPT